MDSVAKFIVLASVAFIVIGIYESSRPVNMGEMLMSTAVIVGILYFAIPEKKQ